MKAEFTTPCGDIACYVPELPYAAPEIAVSYVELENFLASSASLNVTDPPQIEDEEDGGTVNDDVIYGL
jgi:hypothetical protein